MVPLWNRLSRHEDLYRRFGLTDGCIATDNASIDKLWKLIGVGTPVHIHPAD
jgi:L,D-peptidoglycan transpeptidase YkuD (ErfK/YbiS/YcfS/YnhG family)